MRKQRTRRKILPALALGLAGFLLAGGQQIKGH